MFWADYIADTGHLTSVENSAYLMLIAHYWRTGEPLPNDDARLQRASRTTTSEWKRARAAVLEFFTLDGDEDLWRHKRIDRELGLMRERYERRRAAGEKGNAAQGKLIAMPSPEQRNA